MKPSRADLVHAREESLVLLAISRAASFDEPPEDVPHTAALPLMGDSSGDRPFDWAKFVGLARRHASVAAAYRFVADTRLDARVPADSLQAMKLGYALAQATYIKNLIELRELADGLRREVIPALVMKGIPLAARLYSEPAVRVSRDIDLLCGMDELPRVERLLEELGYSLHPGRLGSDGYRRYHYHLVYSRGASSESVVEVHWNVRHPGKGIHLDIEPLIRHAAAADVAGTDVAALDDPHSLWQLAVNLSYSGFLEARDLGDLRRLSRRLTEKDWETIVEFSHKTGTFNEFSAALAVAEKAFGRFVPEKHRSVTRPRSDIRAMFLPPYSPRTVAWRWLPFRGAQRLSVNLFMREGLGRKLRYLYHIVIPNGESLIETRSGRAAPERLTQKLRLYASGVWIAAKVLAVSALLGPLVRTGFLAYEWANPERHVDLAARPRGGDPAGT